MKRILSSGIIITLTLVFTTGIGTAQKQGSDEFRNQVVEKGNYSLVKQRLNKLMIQRCVLGIFVCQGLP